MTMLTIVWDGEWVALKSAVKAAAILTKHGFQVRIGVMPKNKDPADVPGDTVRYVIENAIRYSRRLEAKVRLRDPYALKHA